MKREWTNNLNSHGIARGDLASYLFCAIISIGFINCAHQSDDNYSQRRPREIASPPVAPPSGPVPRTASGATLPSQPPSTSGALSVPKPRASVSDKAGSTSNSSSTAASKRKAPNAGKINVSAMQLKMDSSLSPPVKRLVTNAEESLKKGRVHEARAQADRAYRMDLRDPRTSFLLAKVAVVENDFEGAEQWAMRSLEYINDNSNKAVVWSLISRVRERAGSSESGVAKSAKKRDSARR